MISVTNPKRGLLGLSDPAPVDVVNPNGQSAILLTCEHAGRMIPRSLGDLGAPRNIFDQHIAYDIGAEKLARHLSKVLDATLILQIYSRLVVDCNRLFTAADCIPWVSDGTSIPANNVLSQSAKRQRFDEIHRPFHNTLSDLLDQRKAVDIPTVLVSVHSFTPKLQTSGFERPWHVGLLHGDDDRYARQIQIDLLDIAPYLNIALNEPYDIDYASDYTIPMHADKRKLLHVLLEIRNDELQTPAQCESWGERLAQVLTTSLNRLLVP